MVLLMIQENPNAFSPEEMARYNRQVILPQIGEEGQYRLRQARVLIIGLGGLGSPAALYLAAAGVGTLGLADFDSVAVSNLHRQVIHRTETIGKSKISSGEAQIKALNPHCQIQRHPQGIQRDNALSLLSDYDIVVDGSDNFGTRYLVTDSCALVGKPLVYGSLFQFEGQVSFFYPSGNTPCYRCLFPIPPEPGTVPNCAQAGVFGALCGVIGSLQALEGIKWITGTGENLAGKLLVVDSLSMEFRRLNLKKDPNCPLCGENPRIRNLDTEDYEYFCQTELNPDSSEKAPMDLGNPPAEIDVAQAAEWHRETPPPAAFLDVRENFERQICKIPNSLHIPMGQIGEHLETLPKDQPLVVYCHHGSRSNQVTQFLRRRGFEKATNLAGGIDAWAREIDPEIQRY